MSSPVALLRGALASPVERGLLGSLMAFVGMGLASLPLVAPPGGGAGDLVVRLGTLIGGAATALVLFRLVRALLPDRPEVAIAATSFFATLPRVAGLSVTGELRSLAALATLVAVLAVIGVVGDRRGAGRAVVAMIAVVLAVGLHAAPLVRGAEATHALEGVGRVASDPAARLALVDQPWLLPGASGVGDGPRAVIRMLAAALAIGAGVGLVRLVRRGGRSGTGRQRWSPALLAGLAIMAVPVAVSRVASGSLLMSDATPAAGACVVAVMALAATRSPPVLQIAVVMVGLLGFQVLESQAVVSLGRISGSEFALALVLDRAGLPLAQAFYMAHVTLFGAGVALVTSALGDASAPVLEQRGASGGGMKASIEEEAT